MIRIYMMLGLAVMVTSGVAYHFWKMDSLNRQISALEATVQGQAQVITRQSEVNEQNLREIDSMKAHQQEQTDEIAGLMNENNKLVEAKNRYLRIFSDHNLSRLARAKPALIETRVNRGTSAVFRSIEEDSKMDNPLSPSVPLLGRDND